MPKQICYNIFLVEISVDLLPDGNFHWQFRSCFVTLCYKGCFISWFQITCLSTAICHALQLMLTVVYLECLILPFVVHGSQIPSTS